MKRAIAITLFGIITQVVSAQLVVGSNGNVGIKVADASSVNTT